MQSKATELPRLRARALGGLGGLGAFFGMGFGSFESEAAERERQQLVGRLGQAGVQWSVTLVLPSIEGI